jgi:hypothetical protein
MAPNMAQDGGATAPTPRDVSQEAFVANLPAEQRILYHNFVNQYQQQNGAGTVPMEEVTDHRRELISVTSSLTGESEGSFGERMKRVFRQFKFVVMEHTGRCFGQEEWYGRKGWKSKALERIVELQSNVSNKLKEAFTSKQCACAL